MASSEYTKVCRRKLWFWRVIDVVVLLSPLIGYFCFAISSGQVTTSGKVSLVGTVAIALVLVVFNVIAQKRLRCPIWIVLIGFFIAIRDWLLPLVILLAIVSVLDDLILTPLISYYRTKLISSKTIDDRELMTNGDRKD